MKVENIDWLSASFNQVPCYFRNVDDMGLSHVARLNTYHNDDLMYKYEDVHGVRYESCDFILESDREKYKVISYTGRDNFIDALINNKEFFVENNDNDVMRELFEIAKLQGYKCIHDVEKFLEKGILKTMHFNRNSNDNITLSSSSIAKTDEYLPDDDLFKMCICDEFQWDDIIADEVACYFWNGEEKPERPHPGLLKSVELYDFKDDSGTTWEYCEPILKDDQKTYENK